MRKPLRGEAPCEGSTIPEAGLQWSFASVGAWLSLVEHSVRDRGVGGSNPLAPTNRIPRKTPQKALETGPLLCTAHRFRTCREVLPDAGRLRSSCQYGCQSVTEKLPSGRE